MQTHSELPNSDPSPPAPLRKPNRRHVPWLLRRIWDRLNRKNMHFMGVVVGEEGSGKSHTAVKIANAVDPSFNADRVIFDVADLLQVLQDGDHEPGNFYVLDEAGVQLGRRTWQERGQVLANQALQLVRNHNLGLIFTLPRLGELDSQAQGRLQAVLEMTDKVDGEYVTGKWKFTDPDRMDETGKIYKKYPRRREDGVVKRITSVSFRPPDPELIEPYEERKGDFQEEFYQKTIEQLSDGDEEEEDSSSISPKEIAQEIASDGVEQYVSRNGTTKEPYINKDLIRVEHEVSHSDANAIKSILERTFSKKQLEEKA